MSANGARSADDPPSADLARRLRALPGERSAPYGWEEFERRAAARGSPSGAARRVRWAAAAAVLAAAAAGIFAWVQSGPAARTDRPAEDHLAGIRNAVIAVASDPPDGGAGHRMGVGVPVAASAFGATGDARTAAAERWLASQPRDPAVVSVGAHSAVAGLEDRLAQVDDLLSAARTQGVQPTSLAALEEQRSRLVRSLAQVRFAESLVAESSH